MVAKAPPTHRTEGRITVILRGPQPGKNYFGKEREEDSPSDRKKERTGPSSRRSISLKKEEGDQMEAEKKRKWMRRRVRRKKKKGEKDVFYTVIRKKSPLYLLVKIKKGRKRGVGRG